MVEESITADGMLKAIIVVPNEKTVEFGSLLAIARAEARKREKTSKNPPILALKFIPELRVYVGVYEAPSISKHDQTCEVKH